MSKTKINVCLFAGEASGDLQGALLVKSLKEAASRDNSLEFELWGVCGQLLVNEGVEPFMPVEEFNIMGLAEIVASYNKVSSHFKKIIRQLEIRKTKLLICVDFPGFNLRLIEEAKKRGIFVIYHIPPKVWSHGLKRIEILKKYTDIVTTIFPFEQEFFKKHGLDTLFVGNPLKDAVENYKRLHSLSDTLSTHFPSLNLKTDKYIDVFRVGILPGSRISEVNTMLPLMLEALWELKKVKPNAHGLIAQAPTISDVLIENHIHNFLKKSSLTFDWFKDNVTLIKNDSYAVMQSSHYAWVCSGTATLETAFFLTPLSAAYIVHPVTAWLAKKLLKIPYVTLVNLVAEKKVIPEFLQDEAKASNLVSHLLELEENLEIKQKMIQDLQTISNKFFENALEKSADEIIKKLKRIV